MSLIKGDLDIFTASKIKQRAMSNAAAVTQSMIDAANSGSHGDTPIERALFIALQSQIEVCGYGIFALWSIEKDHDIGARAKAAVGDDSTYQQCLFYSRQKVLLDWPIDFVFAKKNRYDEASLLCVECDGHDFHERTKEQAAKDRSRDRRLQEAGYTIFRFTGSEIRNNPCECADQILNWALNEWLFGHQRHGRFY